MTSWLEYIGDIFQHNALIKVTTVDLPFESTKKLAFPTPWLPILCFLEAFGLNGKSQKKKNQTKQDKTKQNTNPVNCKGYSFTIFGFLFGGGVVFMPQYAGKSVLGGRGREANLHLYCLPSVV